MEVEDLTGLSASGDPAPGTGSVGGCADSGEAAGFHKKNRSGAAKRRGGRGSWPLRGRFQATPDSVNGSEGGTCRQERPARLCGNASLGAEKRQETLENRDFRIGG